MKKLLFRGVATALATPFKKNSVRILYMISKKDTTIFNKRMLERVGKKQTDFCCG